MIKSLISKLSKQENVPVNPNSSKNWVDDPQNEIRRNNLLAKELPRKSVNSGLSASFEVKTPIESPDDAVVEKMTTSPSEDPVQNERLKQKQVSSQYY